MSPMPTTATAAVGLLLLAAAALPGCRSDGGFGRRGSGESLAFALGSVRTHEARAWEATSQRVASLPATVEQEFERAPDEWLNTYTLYFEGEASR